MTLYINKNNVCMQKNEYQYQQDNALKEQEVKNKEDQDKNVTIERSKRVKREYKRRSFKKL